MNRVAREPNIRYSLGTGFILAGFVLLVNNLIRVLSDSLKGGFNSPLMTSAIVIIALFIVVLGAMLVASSLNTTLFEANRNWRNDRKQRRKSTESRKKSNT